jgi:hypothetical protein
MNRSYIENELRWYFQDYPDMGWKRDPQILLKALNCLQGDRYIRLTRSREKDERFLYGWLKNRVRL